MYLYMYMYMYTYVFLYMSKCMYMCMCIYIDIYADSLYKRTMRFRGASMFWFVLSERRIPED